MIGGVTLDATFGALRLLCRTCRAVDRRLLRCSPARRLPIANAKPGFPCPHAPGAGKYCAACESKAAAKPFAANRCVRCLPNYGLDATNKCTLLLGTTGTGLDACRRTSMNAGCAGELVGSGHASSVFCKLQCARSALCSNAAAHRSKRRPLSQPHRLDPGFALLPLSLLGRTALPRCSPCIVCAPTNLLAPDIPARAAECNPDGTCRRCTTAGAVLMPSAAIWLDAGYPETQVQSIGYSFCNCGWL